jgi:hypothetical protein
MCGWKQVRCPLSVVRCMGTANHGLRTMDALFKFTCYERAMVVPVNQLRSKLMMRLTLYEKRKKAIGP